MVADDESRKACGQDGREQPRESDHDAPRSPGKQFLGWFIAVLSGIAEPGPVGVAIW
jgi:hypothetical protein